jgi:phosphotransferase system enzyme I (PtsI)
LAWDKTKILGFVTAKGSCFSHAAILARTLGIPAICQLENYDALKEGNYALLDGTNGTLIVEPSIECTCEFEKKWIEDTKHKVLLRELIGKNAQTLDGTKVELCANIGSLCDLEAALSVGAEGIGLFRSEFIYMERSSLPTEEEQLVIYRRALEAAQGKRVIVRTLDLGADKHASYLKIPKEENPALGYRAIRICFDRPDIFNTQLRALLRASAYGKLGIMFPMITGLEQTRECIQRTRELANVLKNEGHVVSDNIELGIMIETPAAALLSDLLAEEVDFFSIGTNDLTQYTLAVDRMNSKLSYLYDPRHKAVLRLIKLVTENAHRAGKWVGICGESAADPFLTAFYLSIGIDELSVSWSSLLSVKEKIISMDLADQSEHVEKLI